MVAVAGQIRISTCASGSAALISRSISRRSIGIALSSDQLGGVGAPAM